MFSTIGLRTWRVSPTLSYYWVNKKALTTTKYGETRYGLFTISFNGGLQVRTWDRITRLTCTNLDIIKPVATSQASVMSAACDAACLSHFTTRCTVYRVLSSVHNLLLMVVAIAASLSGIGAAYMWVFGVKSPLPAMVFLLSGLGLLLAWTYYAWISYTQLFLLSMESHVSHGQDVHSTLFPTWDSRRGSRLVPRASTH